MCHRLGTTTVVMNALLLWFGIKITARVVGALGETTTAQSLQCSTAKRFSNFLLYTVLQTKALLVLE